MDCKKQLQSVLQTSSSEMKPQANDVVHERRSANYKPNIWNYDYLQSLSSIYDVRILSNIFHENIIVTRIFVSQLLQLLCGQHLVNVYPFHKDLTFFFTILMLCQQILPKRNYNIFLSN